MNQFYNPIFFNFTLLTNDFWCEEKWISAYGETLRTIHSLTISHVGQLDNIQYVIIFVDINIEYQEECYQKTEELALHTIFDRQNFNVRNTHTLNYFLTRIATKCENSWTIKSYIPFAKYYRTYVPWEPL